MLTSGIAPDAMFQASALGFPEGRTGAQSFAAALDAVAGALDAADAQAGAVALGRGSVAEASIARAKADVLLEIAAVTASRVSAAVTTLLQTQV
jgi:hypothetical protein